MLHLKVILAVFSSQFYRQIVNKKKNKPRHYDIIKLVIASYIGRYDFNRSELEKKTLNRVSVEKNTLNST